MSEILNITPSAVYRANGSSWAAEDYRVGFNSGNTWRSKIVIPVGSFSGKSKKLVVQLITDRTSYPSGAYGVLSENGNLTGDQVISDTVVGSYYNAPHADLLANAIAQSYSYSDPDGTSRVPSSSASTGYTFYFVFDTDQLKPNTTYYVYSMRNVDSGGSTAFTVAKLGGISAALTYDASFEVTERHYTKAEDGKLTQFGTDVLKLISTGASYTPDIKTPPKDYTTKGIRFTAYSTDWNRVGSGVPGVDYITVNENLTVEVYYPYAPPEGYIYYLKGGTDTECEVFQYKDGVDIPVNLLYNKNGTDIEI